MQEERVAAEDVRRGEPKKRSVASTISLFKKVNFVLQCGDKSVTYREMVDISKGIWREELSRRVTDLKQLDFYIKPEEGKVYYVMNGDTNGSFDL